MNPTPLSANGITAALLIRIPEQFPNVRVWRSNVLVARAGDRIVRAGLTGQADISGIGGPRGVRLEIEVKAGKDRISPAQENFCAMIRRHGGIYILARDIEQALVELKTQMEARGC